MLQPTRNLIYSLRLRFCSRGALVGCNRLPPTPTGSPGVMVAIALRPCIVRVVPYILPVTSQCAHACCPNSISELGHHGKSIWHVVQTCAPALLTSPLTAA